MVQQESKVVEREHRRGTYGLRPETIQRLNLRIKRVPGYTIKRTMFILKDKDGKTLATERVDNY